ncbi:MAG: ABC transporter ATP-binding protein [Acidobacteriota bacterium]|jgi:iron complex transport system ATP-binding protein|nr:ABC transporter ATP-binding protein [Acidobacteriota bacterium]
MRELLRLDGLSAGYGKARVVGDVSFSIREGEYCALLGLNGSGKTTLLKTICGLLPAQGGRCVVEGVDCTSFHEHKRARRLAYIPQRHSAMDGLSVLDVVLMGLNPHLGLLENPSKAQRQACRDALAKMGLGGAAHRDFGRLSGGQQQMVILARTLAQDAPVMLMDEPDSALDFLNKHLVLKNIRDLIHAEGKAGLVTLHNPNFALTYCDRLLLLKEGTLVADVQMRDSSVQGLEKALSDIYGDVVILERDGQYMVGLRPARCPTS